MAAVDEHIAGAYGSNEVFKQASAAQTTEQGMLGFEGKAPKQPEGGRYVGPQGASQGRSMSMPIIEQVKDHQAKSQLQKRALAARGDLRLPSFKSLGIALPRPDHLLTPPDDADNLIFDPLPAAAQATSVPRSAPSLPTIPSTRIASTDQDTPPQESESTMNQDTEKTETIPSTGQPSQATDTVTQNITSTEPVLVRHLSSSSEEETPRGPVWLEKAVDAVVANVPTNGAWNTLSTLCQCQPCPIPSDARPIMTAFTPILEALQANLRDGQYIDVTHAVPPQFNIALLPSSPMSTPYSTSGQPDYFSMSIFSRAVVALHHDDALKSQVPSSPHPLVPPNTVGVTLLERYIPPSSAQEFVDLFELEAPSVLVDRLMELSPNGGSLVFIYPTMNGATAFASRYLGPLLDPLLRTMVSIHGLTSDLSQDIGRMAAVDAMYTFDKTLRKIIALISKLSRKTSGSSNYARRYSLVQSSKQTVDISRETWTEWWLHQEAPRIREVVRRYYKRGSRLPERREITEGGLAREVLDGVKGRSYGPYDKPRDGVEVGVFVIKRSA